MPNWTLEQWRVFLTGVGIIPAIWAALQAWRFFQPVERLYGEAIFSPYKTNPAEAHLPSDVEWFSLSSVARAYWRVKVTNTGRKTLKSVRLSVPNLRIFQIEDAKFNDEQPSTITIGELAPRQQVTVHAWTDDFSPRFFGVNAHLVHDDGHGTLRVHQPLHPFFVWLSVNGKCL